MQMHPWMPEQPALDDRALVGAGVVQYQMQLQFGRRCSLYGLQEVTKLNAAVTLVNFCNDRPRLDVQRCKKISCAMANVVVGVTLRLPRAHGDEVAPEFWSA